MAEDGMDYSSKREDDVVARQLRELASDLAEMVRLGDICADAANEWYSMKADQWALGLS